MMAAFATMDSLSFNGDVLAFQAQFLSAKRELDNTRATMAEYTICKLMRAFDGKSKTIQFKIAEDFNQLDMNDPNINLYDMVQGYCADLAAVGDLKPHRVSIVRIAISPTR